MHKSGVFTFGFLLSSLIMLAAMPIFNQHNGFSNVAMAQGYNNYNDNKYSQYPTKENKYECRTGPFEGFFVSSVEFCKFKFHDNDGKDHSDRDNKTITIDLYTVEGNTTTGSAGTEDFPFITSTANCNEGDVSTGGSFELEGNATIRASEPLDNETGWEAVAEVFGNATEPGDALGAVTADVVCLDNPIEVH